MEIEKAKLAHSLYARRDELRSSILTMRSRVEKNRFGTTTVTIPTSWLPEVIRVAESELEAIDGEISML